jgi:very-short-patch-repair endonuclease
VDFCSVKYKLIVELDGGGHSDQEEYDAARTEYLKGRGFRVLRFWNHEVNRDLESVVRTIFEANADLA